MSAVAASDHPALTAVVRRLRNDQPAVIAERSMPYRNGPIEGADSADPPAPTLPCASAGGLAVPRRGCCSAGRRPGEAWSTC